MISLPLDCSRAIHATTSGAFRLFLLVALAACQLLILATAADAAFRQPPGSRIAIDLGASFTPSERYSGFVDEQSGAAFIVIELPGAAYDEMKTLPESKADLEAQGLSGLTQETLEGRKEPYVYMAGKQETEAGPLAKFVLIFRENRRTGMIIANIPQAALDNGTFTRAQIEKILATATVKDKAGKARQSYRFGYLGPFQEAFSMGPLSQAYSTSGTVPDPDENRMIMEPILVVSQSADARQIDAKSVAQRSFQALGGLQDKSVENEQPVTIGGLSGYQIRGEASDSISGERIVLIFVMLEGDPAGYYALVGTMPIADKEKFMPEMDKVIDSFETVKAEP